MARLQRTVTFVDGERLQPSKLTALVSQATLVDLTKADLDSSFSGDGIFYGDASPGVTFGFLWFNTGTGTEGFLTPIISPSNASVASFVYRTPYSESIFWASSAISAGSPVFIGRAGDARDFTIFDGLLLMNVWSMVGSPTASGTHYALAVATESKDAGEPIKCATAGLIPVHTFGSAASIGSPLFLNIAGSANLFSQGTPTAQSSIWGLALDNSASTSFHNRAYLLWGAGPTNIDML